MVKSNCKFLLQGIFLVFMGYVNVNAQWNDNFDDGDLISNPAWIDDSSDFIVNSIGQLQLSAPSLADKSVIYTDSRVSVNSTWEFDVFMDFNPSSSNYCRVFLMADQFLSATIENGYFLKIGSTNDDICLYVKKNNSETLLIDGRNKMLNTATVNLSVKVTRDSEGNWELYCDTTGSRNYKPVGSTTNLDVVSSKYFVVECVYTGTRCDKFSFDNFGVLGEKYSDGTIPQLIHYKCLSGSAIECVFSECIVNPDKSNFKLNDSYYPLQIEQQQNSVLLHFEERFNCSTDNILTINGVKDEWDNEMPDTTIDFRYCTPLLFDVVFNEIMADPSPRVELPDAEYIELFNKSAKPLNVNNWKLVTGNTQFTFPDTIFYPDTYLILCKSDYVPDMQQYGFTLGLFNSSTTLNNSEQFLKLYDSENNLIAYVNYEDSWYKDEYKAQGGWSLEQIDPLNPCAGSQNWDAAQGYYGGTPGKMNSVYALNPDSELPELKWLYMPNDSVVWINFNEPLLSGRKFNVSDFVFSSDIDIKPNISVGGDNYNIVKLGLQQSLEKTKQYQLTINSNITDCVGNSILEPIDTLIGIPEPIDSFDIVINEVLFNPASFCPEYIELYNRSNKILDGSSLVLSFTNSSSIHTFRACCDSFLFYPHSYLLISSEPEMLSRYFENFNSKVTHTCTVWTSLDDKSGTIKLFTKNLRELDAFTYSEEMHYKALTTKEGVSLERLNSDLPTNLLDNWHSASEISGYGTPGLPNSQQMNGDQNQQMVSLEKELFSPDNDGYEDLLKININASSTGDRISAIIFDATGRKVRQLLNNVAPNNNYFFTWDGISDEGKLCYPGIYMVFVRIVGENGQVKEFKKSCILAIKR